MSLSFAASVVFRDARYKRIAGWMVVVSLASSPLLLGAGFALEIKPLAVASFGMLGFTVIAFLAFLVTVELWARLERREETALKAATVEVTRDELILRWEETGRRHRAVPLSAIVRAWMKDGGRAEIELADRSQVVIGGLSPEKLSELFRALRTTAAERTAVTRVASVAETKSGCLLVAALGFIPMTGCLGLGVLVWVVPGLLAIGALVARAQLGQALEALCALAVVVSVTLGALMFFIETLRRRRLIIGTDGVALTTYWRRRFVPMESIKEVRYDTSSVRLLRHDGPEIVLPRAPEALARRIREAIAIGGEAIDLLPQLGQLAREGRDVEEWAESLRKLAATPSRYREATLQAEQLLDLALDADAHPEHRVAAAYALSTSGETRLLDRVRSASRACADDDLRRALEEAVEGRISERLVARATKRRRRAG